MCLTCLDVKVPEGKGSKQGFIKRDELEFWDILGFLQDLLIYEKLGMSWELEYSSI